MTSPTEEGAEEQGKPFGSVAAVRNRQEFPAEEREGGKAATLARSTLEAWG
jgi:hypothetical protein